MSMSTHVQFLRSPDDKEYQSMLEVLNACIKAGVKTPKKVDDYFGNCEDPEYPLEIEAESREFSDHDREGVEIDVENIPSGVKTIRFYNSW